MCCHSGRKPRCIETRNKHFEWFMSQPLVGCGNRNPRHRCERLVNVEDESEIVAIGESKPYNSGGFGVVFRGVCVIKRGEEFERYGDVVAKKSRRILYATSDKVKSINWIG